MSKSEEVKKIEAELKDILKRIRQASDIPEMLRLNSRVNELNDQLEKIAKSIS